MSEIKELRDQTNLTQQEAAEACDINPTTFGAYERGDRTPDFRTMDKIRRVLGDGKEEQRYVSRTSDDLDSGEDLQVVPTVEIDDSVQVVNETLQLPTEWIRQQYEVEPSRFCVLRVYGTAMHPTLLPGQRVYAIRHQGEDLRDGAIYAMKSESGAKVRRIETTRTEDGPAIFVRSDNDSFTDYWQRPEPFLNAHEVIAKAVQVSTML
jgi:transcriptional regulator with XRE-family HTH domain